jgi:adenine-specific DNA-methyltransferase
MDIVGLFEHLDEALDGWLIKSENYQALNTLRPRFREQVKTIYIDPPYNTREGEFAYRDKFRHASWMAMMSDRLDLGRSFLSEDGGIFTSIDDNEQAYLREIMNQRFGADNFIANIVWQKRTAPDHRAAIGPAHDYIMVYARFQDLFKKSINRLPLSEERLSEYRNPDNDPRGPWASVDISGQIGHATEDQFYEITTPAGVKYRPPEGRCWALAESTFESLVAEGKIWFGQDGTSRPRLKKYLSESDGTAAWTWWSNDEVGHNQEATKELNGLFGPGVEFTTPKPVQLIKRIFRLTTDAEKSTLALDFFAGSGTTAHAVMNLNREDGGRRKYILVEMADYFDDVLLPRVKKVAFSSEWKDGVAQEDGQGMSHFVKYYELEQYEEVLRKAQYVEDAAPFDNPYQDPYQQYVFLRDLKMLHALELDPDENQVEVDLSVLYNDIDLAETLANLRGKWIARITPAYVEFEDGERIDLQDLDWELIKPLIWW